jgi:regulator of RNase E activity RraA
MAEETITDELLVRLRALDTCAVSDALNTLGREGVALGVHGLTAPTRIAGWAVTVRLGPPGDTPPDRHLCTAAVEAAGPGQVIVVSAGGRLDTAGWGGILSRAATARGIEGVVVDGAARDVDESHELGLPVYARAGVPRTARGRLVETGWGGPVPVGELVVDTGDLVLADRSGVVFVPAAIADEVIAKAETIATREAAMACRIAEGHPVSQVMSGDYETMLKADA